MLEQTGSNEINWRIAMNEESLNMQIRKFLKKVGISSQREIERAVREAAGNGKVNAGDKIPVSMTLSVESLGISLIIEDDIRIDDSN
jgi:hypothetical protein